FAEIRFDYSDQARQLVKKIASEATDPTQPLSISTCVRRAVFFSNPRYVTQYHPELFEFMFRGATHTEEQQVALRKRAADQYAQLRNESATAICLALSNLEVLVWEDEFAVDRDFFTKFYVCPAKHVRLNRVFIDGVWPMRPPLTAATWPVLSLHLDVMWRPSEYLPERKWLVDHNKWRQHLRNLSGLKRLALCDDTYPIPMLNMDAENYYTVQFVTDQERAEAEHQMPACLEENGRSHYKLQQTTLTAFLMIKKYGGELAKTACSQNLRHTLQYYQHWNGSSADSDRSSGANSLQYQFRSTCGASDKRKGRVPHLLAEYVWNHYR
ncbi:hypothetical protein EDB81DRAFT_907486, partial [Dactylonectria macrodidyma]